MIFEVLMAPNFKILNFRQVMSCSWYSGTITASECVTCIITMRHHLPEDQCIKGKEPLLHGKHYTV